MKVITSDEETSIDLFIMLMKTIIKTNNKDLISLKFRSYN